MTEPAVDAAGQRRRVVPFAYGDGGAMLTYQDDATGRVRWRDVHDLALPLDEVRGPEPPRAGDFT